MTVLVVAAHPDDETLGAGAATARWRNEGREVHWLVLGEGTTSRAASSDESVAAQSEALLAAAGELDVTSVTRHALADNRFDSIDLLDIVQLVEATVDDVRPTLVVTHDAADVNVDHRRVHAAIGAAARPLPGRSVNAVWTMEVPSSTEWGFESFGAFRPNRFVDVSGFIDLKCVALDHYRTEMRSFPHPRSPEAIRALAGWRGGTAGVEAAEAFSISWERS